MTVTLDQLRTPPTRAELLQENIEQLESLGFNVTAWQDGSPQKTLLTVFATVIADLCEVIKQLTEMGFSELSFGDALRELSRNVYDNTRQEATKASWTERLTSVAGVPYTIVPGQLRFTTGTGAEFVNTTGGTLNAGSFLDVTVVATLAGISSLAPNTITTMLTPLAGVTATNTTLLQVGNDAETNASLKLRNRTKWARLSVELVRDAYINIALNADPNIRKADVDDRNPRGAGTIDVYVGGDASVVSDGVAAAAQAVFATRAFQTSPSWPPPSDSRVYVKKAQATALSIAGTVYYDPATDLTLLSARVTAALTAFIGTLPLGGLPYPSPGRVVPKNEIENAIRGVEGVKTVVLTTPAGDTAVSTFSIVTLGTVGLSFVQSSG